MTAAVSTPDDPRPIEAEVDHLPTAPRPARRYSLNDGHRHVYGHEYAYSRSEKHRKCIMPGCPKVQVWKA